MHFNHRILRVLRFQCKFGFHVDDSLEHAIRNKTIQVGALLFKWRFDNMTKEKLRLVSRKRTLEEIYKFFDRMLLPIRC
jgi:tRNA nucleotidyltransferase/poly(A) polymerase